MMLKGPFEAMPAMRPVLMPSAVHDMHGGPLGLTKFDEGVWP